MVCGLRFPGPFLLRETREREREREREMDNRDGDETLEEGRVALHLLERQLKNSASQRESLSQDDASEGSSRQNGGGSKQSLSLMAERRLLDQQPRDARLQMRKGSPLGLTLEVWKIHLRYFVDFG